MTPCYRLSPPRNDGAGLGAHFFAGGVVERLGDDLRRVHLAIDLDFERGAVDGEFGRHVAERHRLLHMVRVAARGHVADAFAVLQDRLVVRHAGLEPEPRLDVDLLAELARKRKPRGAGGDEHNSVIDDAGHGFNPRAVAYHSARNP